MVSLMLTLNIISHFFLMFLLLNLNKSMFAGLMRKDEKILATSFHRKILLLPLVAILWLYRYL